MWMSKFHYADKQIIEILEELKEEIKQKNSSSITQSYIDSIEYAVTFLNHLDDTLPTILEPPYKVGDTVYVLEYEDDKPIDYSGYIFIMANNDFAFLSPVINGERNPMEICNEFFDRYINEEYNCGIIVPFSELYTKEKAEKALERLRNDC